MLLPVVIKSIINRNIIFFNFSDTTPSRGGNQNLILPSFKKGHNVANNTNQVKQKTCTV